MLKKLKIAAIVAVITAAFPAHAQSANDWMRIDQARDPGYQSAVRSTHRNYGNYGGYGTAPVVVVRDQQESTCVAFVFCKTRRPRNQAGDMCMDANGVAYALDRDLRWYRLPDSSPAHMNMGSVTTRCGWNNAYHAEN